MHEVVANYIGLDSATNLYRVNVKMANPTGNIGDAGVVRSFDDENKAKTYARLVNSLGKDVFEMNKPAENDVKPDTDDKFQFSGETVEKAEGKQTECPPISTSQAWLKRLTNEQIIAINEKREVPEGTKIRPNGFGGYYIAHNFLNLFSGTRIVPEGFELKKNIFGFTIIVPKGTQGTLIKDVPAK